MKIELARRSLIAGLVAFGVTAPAIVRAGSLMPVKAYIETDPLLLAELMERLDDRSQLWDGHYAELYGLPILGEVDPKTRQIVGLH